MTFVLSCVPLCTRPKIESFSVCVLYCQSAQLSARSQPRGFYVFPRGVCNIQCSSFCDEVSCECDK